MNLLKPSFSPWKLDDITFVVTVCNAYKDRFEAIRDTWATQASKVVYLAGSPDSHQGWQGYETGDDYASVPRRFHEFVRDYTDRNMFENGSKWWVIVDDDTWVFPERMVELLSRCSEPDVPVLAGTFYPTTEADLKKCTHRPEQYKGLWFVCGGNGMIFNREALIAIGHYLNENPNYPSNLHGDITLSWLYNEISANRQCIETSPLSAEQLLAGSQSAFASTAHPVPPEYMYKIFRANYAQTGQSVYSK